MSTIAFTPPPLRQDIIRYDWIAVDESGRVVQSGTVPARGPYRFNIDESGRQSLVVSVASIAMIDGQEQRSQDASIDIEVLTRTPFNREIPPCRNLQKV